MKLLAATVLIASALSAQELPSTLLERKLLKKIEALDAATLGVIGIAAIDLKTNQVIRYNADVIFPQASSIKIPILFEVFQAERSGRLKFDTRVTLTPSDTVGGSGHLRILLRSGPVTLTVLDLATAMIETSDNTATNRLIAIVGREAVNESLKKSGFAHTRLRRIMLEPGAAAQDRENVSTPMEMARLAELLYHGKAVDPDASRRMIEILKLPEGSFRTSIPSDVPVAAKPGELNGVRAETGIVFLPGRPFVLSAMAAYLEPGINPIPAIARLFYEHFEKLAKSNRYGHKLQ